MLSSVRRAGQAVPRLTAPHHRLRAIRGRSLATVSDTTSTSSTIDLARLPQIGSKLHGFTLQRTKHVPELELSALHFTHDKTGADYLHIARDDSNNVFSIGFKTNPPDATGVPHILEHVTLCGSEKYPVRDPFFKMLPRSLQNFMNAFTSSDYTMYPFATTNAQDFKNLMGVYLDSTLHPLLKQSDFLQEGWRLGPENPAAPPTGNGKEDIIFKGVVYNEMKGQMSDATYLFYIRFFETILPALNNSGGDPQKITDLTYEQLANYHKAHYHPSNSKILTYGDQPVDAHLQILHQQLDRFDKSNVKPEPKYPIELNGSTEIVVHGPIDALTPAESQYKTSTTWLVGDTTNIQEAFALQLAFAVLLDGYGAPMYRALIESGLGTDYSPNTGYDSSGLRGIFSVGLNGVSEENVPRVKETVTATIRDVVQRGFDSHKIEGWLHQLELSIKHKNSQFGMSTIQRLKPQWFNGIDPFDALAWNSIIDGFKAEYAKGGYLEGLFKKYLFNDNTLTFTMAPNAKYGEELAAEESSRLQSKIKDAVAQFPSEEAAYKEMRAREAALVKEQEEGRSQPLDSLPTLHVRDIPRQSQKYEVRENTVSNEVKVQWRETATNGLTYFRAIAPFTALPEDLRMLVPLFCDTLLRIGTKQRSMEELEDMIKLQTGGLSFGYHASPSAVDFNKTEEGLSFGGYALDRNVASMFDLLNVLLVETDFDSDKARQMVRQLLQAGAASATDAIASRGNAYAMRAASANLIEVSRNTEQTSGISQVQFITHLAANATEESKTMSEVLDKLKTLQRLTLSSIARASRAAITCTSGSASYNQSRFADFLTSVRPVETKDPATEAISTNSAPFTPSSGTKEFYPFPGYAVSYSALSVATVPYTHPTSAAHSLLAPLLTHNHLHLLRETAGAYGASAVFNPLNGLMGSATYRDPSPFAALQTQRDAYAWASGREWSERELNEAKLSFFQGADAPRDVNAQGMGLFLSGVTDEMRQERREKVLDCGVKDIRDVAESLAEQVRMKKGAEAVLGAKEAMKDVGDHKAWKVKEVGIGGGGLEGET